MALNFDSATTEEIRNTLDQTGIPLREISKAVFPNKGVDYLSHKLRVGNFSLADIVNIKGYVNSKFGDGFFDRCYKRHRELTLDERIQEAKNKINTDH